MNNELIKAGFTVYWLFDAPRAVGRTGHGALAILSGATVVYFFSMYHALKPSEVREDPFKFIIGYESYIVRSPFDEVDMRGRSWERLEDKEQKEDIGVGTLVASLSEESEEDRTRFRKRGVYQYVRSIPDVDAQAMMDELNRIEKTARWAMFAPLIQYIGDPAAHNCCSAIWSALEKGGINKHQTSLISQLSASMKFALWVSYFSFIAFAPVSKPSSDNTASVILHVPLVYFFAVLMQSLKNAYDYVTDLTSMAKDPKNISLSTQFLTYLLCMLVNTVGATVSDNACFDLFKFPACVDRRLKEKAGAVAAEKLIGC